MPTYSLDRPASYFDNLLVNSPETARYLMKTYAVHAPDTADGDRGKLVREIDDVRDSGNIKVRSMFDKKIAYLHLSKKSRAQGWKTGNEGADALYGTASYAAGVGVPVYWLPWDESGGIVSLTIPKKGTGARGAPDPDRFFTAAINGCSVFFGGSRDNPTVYHCGGSTDQNGPAAAAKFWRDLVTRMAGNVPGVDKQDYIANQGVRNSAGAYTTQAAKDYETWLKANTSDKLEIEDVRPWGCVMGIRNDAGLWTFYLQENASITYYQLKKKSIFSSKLVRKKEVETYLQVANEAQKVDDKGRPVYIDRKRTVARPIHFYEVYPAQVRSVRIDRPIPKTKHG